MSVKALTAEVAAASSGPRATFRVVVAYGDFDAGRRAMDACKLILSELGDEVEFRSGMWKFDLLRNARLNQRASGQAIDADVIIVATSLGADLPPEVKAWIEGWVPQKRGRTGALVALVGLLGEASADSSAAHSYLKQAASRAGVDFLPHTIRLVEREAPLPGSIPTHPAPEGWGLND